MAFAWLQRLARRAMGSEPPVVAVLRLSGPIGINQGFRRGLAMATAAEQIARLFADKTVKAVALVVNSPGGSPVQSQLIHDRIRALATEKNIPVLTFAEDVAASGGYMLLLAGDEIYANENSIVGSIGVISGGFGFTELMKKVGVERRVYTAGERKVILDPFKPEDPRDVAHLEALQKEVHESFKSMVRTRRDGKLKAPESEVFSGAFWTGARGKDMGLVDGIGDLRSVCREKFGDKVELRVVQPKRSWLGSMSPFGSSAAGHEPADWAGGVIAAAEERALWARFGL